MYDKIRWWAVRDELSKIAEDAQAPSPGGTREAWQAAGRSAKARASSAQPIQVAFG